MRIHKAARNLRLNKVDIKNSFIKRLAIDVCYGLKLHGYSKAEEYQFNLYSLPPSFLDGKAIKDG